MPPLDSDNNNSMALLHGDSFQFETRAGGDRSNHKYYSGIAPSDEISESDMRCA